MKTTPIQDLAGSRVDGSLRPSVVFVAMEACDELLCDMDIQAIRVEMLSNC